MSYTEPARSNRKNAPTSNRDAGKYNVSYTTITTLAVAIGVATWLALLVYLPFGGYADGPYTSFAASYLIIASGTILVVTSASVWLVTRSRQYALYAIMSLLFAFTALSLSGALIYFALPRY